MEILKWFDDWKKHNDNDESDNLDETNFLPKETWKGLRRMILGYVGMIDHYCLKHGLTIHPKRTLSDVCEHLFSKIRRTGGATSHPTCNIAHAAVHRDALTHNKEGKIVEISEVLIANLTILINVVKRRE